MHMRTCAQVDVCMGVGGKKESMTFTMKVGRVGGHMQWSGCEIRIRTCGDEMSPKRFSGEDRRK